MSEFYDTPPRAQPTADPQLQEDVERLRCAVAKLRGEVAACQQVAADLRAEHAAQREVIEQLQASAAQRPAPQPKRKRERSTVTNTRVYDAAVAAFKVARFQTAQGELNVHARILFRHGDFSYAMLLADSVWPTGEWNVNLESPLRALVRFVAPDLGAVAYTDVWRATLGPSSAGSGRPHCWYRFFDDKRGDGSFARNVNVRKSQALYNGVMANFVKVGHAQPDLAVLYQAADRLFPATRGVHTTRRLRERGALMPAVPTDVRVALHLLDIRSESVVRFVLAALRMGEPARVASHPALGRLLDCPEELRHANEELYALAHRAALYVPDTVVGAPLGPLLRADADLPFAVWPRSRGPQEGSCAEGLLGDLGPGVVVMAARRSFSVALQRRNGRTTVLLSARDGKLAYGPESVPRDDRTATYVAVPATLEWSLSFANRLDCVCFAGDCEWEDEHIAQALALARTAYWSFADPASPEADVLMERVRRLARVVP